MNSPFTILDVSCFSSSLSTSVFIATLGSVTNFHLRHQVELPCCHSDYADLI